MGVKKEKVVKERDSGLERTYRVMTCLIYSTSQRVGKTERG